MSEINQLIDSSIILLQRYHSTISEIKELYEDHDDAAAREKEAELKDMIKRALPEKSITSEEMFEKLASETPDNKDTLFVDLFCGIGNKFTNYVASKKENAKIIGMDGFDCFAGSERLGNLTLIDPKYTMLRAAESIAKESGLDNLEFKAISLEKNTDLKIDYHNTKIFTGFKTAGNESTVAYQGVRYGADVIVNVPSLRGNFGVNALADRFISRFMKDKNGQIFPLVMNCCSLGKQYHEKDYNITEDVLASDIGKQLVTLDRAKFLEEYGYQSKILNYSDREARRQGINMCNRVIYAYKKENMLKL